MLVQNLGHCLLRAPEYLWFIYSLLFTYTLCTFTMYRWNNTNPNYAALLIEIKNKG